MLSKRRIEPIPTCVEAGLKTELVTCIENLRSTARPPSHHAVNRITRGLIFKRNTVSFLRLGVFKISEITRNVLLKQTKCMRF